MSRKILDKQFDLYYTDEAVKEKNLTERIIGRWQNMDKNMTPLEKRVELSRLYDFYGELLKDHQKQIFEDYVLNDYSLTEIAAAQGVSRQGIHDTVKRCTKQLEEYEERLHLIKRFEETGSVIRSIKSLTEERDKEQAMAQIRQLSEQILDLI